MAAWSAEERGVGGEGILRLGYADRKLGKAHRLDLGEPRSGLRFDRDIGGAIDLARDAAHLLGERHGVGVKRLARSRAALRERDDSFGELLRSLAAIGPVAA